MSKNHRPLIVGEKVFVYRNLRNKCLSVKSVKTGLVIAHRRGVDLTEVDFKVSAKGRERVRREQKKYVHAGLVGFVAPDLSVGLGANRITYNPYKNETFVNRDGQPVFTAPTAYVTAEGAFI
jgi:hypothetical protein